MDLDAQEMEVRALGVVRLRLVGALFLPGLIILAGCSRDDRESRATIRDRPLPDQIISGFSLTETSMGEKDWHMEAVKAYIYEKRNVLEAESIEVTFFDERGDVRSVLEAEYGRLNRNTDDMEASGNVVVTGSDGVVLMTETLRWQSDIRKIISEDSVRILRADDVLTGWGFRGDPDLGSFRILRDMRATIRARDDG
jgi:LPS export ABC transporter protein LptC